MRTVEELDNAALSTCPSDHGHTEALIDKLYACAGLPKPRIIWCGSPVCAEIFKTVYTKRNPQTVWAVAYVFSQHLDLALQMRSARRAPIKGADAIISALSSVKMQDQTWNRTEQRAAVLRAEWSDIDAVMTREWTQKYESILHELYPSLCVSLSSLIPQTKLGGPSLTQACAVSVMRAWYDDERLDEKAKDTAELLLSVEYFEPYNQLCFVSERKTVCHLRQQEIATPQREIGWQSPTGPIRAEVARDVLHKDGAPALAYPDGLAFYYLNGIKVTREIAETPGEKLDARMVLTEQNVDIRRELVRKIGAERLCLGLNAKSVDKWEDYELLMLDIGDSRQRPYLRMNNPSLGICHIEGVHPDCTTVKKALAWRNGLNEYVKPQQLT